jgi:hypothetical protein
MLNPFERGMLLFEAKAQLSSTINKLTTGKGRKYVKYSQLKQELGVDDAMFDELVTGAQKANRHSNKYIFTNVDDEPAVGITASKRGGKKKIMTPNTTPSANQGYGLAHLDPESDKQSTSGKIRKETLTSGPGAIPPYLKVMEQREDHLWGIYQRLGWRGLDRLDLLPEGWQQMSGPQIVESILHDEFAGIDEEWKSMRQANKNAGFNVDDVNEALALKHSADGRDWTAKCPCGGKVEKDGHHDVECQKCGKEYNSGGQELRSGTSRFKGLQESAYPFTIEMFDADGDPKDCDWSGTGDTLLKDNDGDEDVEDALKQLKKGKKEVYLGGGAATSYILKRK